MIFVCYSKCSTCKKAEDFLEKNNQNFEFREIKENTPTARELFSWIDLSGKDIDKFFNTSGILYREMNLKDKLKNMSNKEKIDLLSSDGMLIKRPLLVTDRKVLVGFKENEWLEELNI